jgi:hypothetical protein
MQLISRGGSTLSSPFNFFNCILRIACVCVPLWPALEDYKEYWWCGVSDWPHRTSEKQLKCIQAHCQS